MKLWFTLFLVFVLAGGSPLMAQNSTQYKTLDQSSAQTYISGYTIARNTNPNRLGRYTIKVDTVYPRVVAQVTRVIQRGDFDASGTLYALARNPLAIVTIDTANGTITDVAPVTGLVDTNHGFTGLSYNSKTGGWFAMSDDLNTCCPELYSVNINTGVFTPIGSSSGPEQLAWLEIDTNGIAYTADAYTDSLYTIDLTTGNTTPVGPLGYDMYNVRHDASIDPATNTLYVLSSTVTNDPISPIVPDLFRVDKTTGSSTSLIGKYSSVQYSLLAIPPVSGGPNGIAALPKQDPSVFPNPSTGIFTIHLENPDMKKWDVYDQTGRKVQSGSVEYRNLSINLSQLAAGVYLLNLYDSQGNKLVTSKKLVKVP